MSYIKVFQELGATTLEPLEVTVENKDVVSPISYIPHFQYLNGRIESLKNFNSQLLILLRENRLLAPIYDNSMSIVDFYVSLTTDEIHVFYLRRIKGVYFALWTVLNLLSREYSWPEHNPFFTSPTIIHHVKIHSAMDLMGYRSEVANFLSSMKHFQYFRLTHNLPQSTEFDLYSQTSGDDGSIYTRTNATSLSLPRLDIQSIQRYDKRNLPDDFVLIHDERDELVCQILFNYALDLDDNPLRVTTMGSERRLMEWFKELINDRLQTDLGEAEKEVIRKMYSISARHNDMNSIRQAVKDKQERVSRDCRNKEDAISMEDIVDIPAPFIAKLPMSNEEFECYNVLNITRLDGLMNPMTREKLSIGTVHDMAKQLSRNIKYLNDYDTSQTIVID